MKAALSRQRGLSLLELMVVAAVAATLTSLAWPSMEGPLLRARRADAMAALTAIEHAQARHHAASGTYASELASLGASVQGSSTGGHYRLELEPGPDGFVARAHAQGRQRRDRACETIVLTVRQGFAQHGPAPACWNR